MESKKANERTNDEVNMGNNPDLELFPPKRNPWESIVKFFEGGFCPLDDKAGHVTKKRAHLSSDDDSNSTITSETDCELSIVSSVVTWDSTTNPRKCYVAFVNMPHD